MYGRNAVHDSSLRSGKESQAETSFCGESTIAGYGELAPGLVPIKKKKNVVRAHLCESVVVPSLAYLTNCSTQTQKGMGDPGPTSSGLRMDAARVGAVC